MANKLLVPAPGGPLLARALRAARAAPAARLIVVVGHDATRIAGAVRRRDRRAVIVHARDASSGMGASLAAGLAALWPIEQEAFVFLSDAPAGDPRLARRLALQWRPGLAAVRPQVRGRPGHPVLIGGALRATGRGLSGDHGFGRLIAQLSTDQYRTIAADRRTIADVDRPSMLHRRVPALR